MLRGGDIKTQKKKQVLNVLHIFTGKLQVFTEF